EPVRGLPDAALQHVVNAELSGDLPDVDSLSLVDEGGISRDDEQPAQARQGGDDFLDDAVREILLLWIAAHVLKGQNRNRGLARRRQGRRGRVPAGRYTVQHDTVSRNRLGHILDLLGGPRGESQSKLLLHFRRDFARDAYSAGISQLLEPGRHIDAFAVAIVAVDDNLTEIDSDPNLDSPVLRHVGTSLRQAALQRHRAFHSIDDAGKFRQQSVAHQLEDAAMVFFDLRLEELSAAGAEAIKASRLVLFHESRIADDVGGKDRRKLPLHGRANPESRLSATINLHLPVRSARPFDRKAPKGRMSGRANGYLRLQR